MASEEELSEMSSLYNRLGRYRDLSLFMAFLIGLALANPRSGPDQGAEAEHGSVIEMLTVVIGGTSSLEEGQPLASKAAMEAMPSMDGGAECAICLEEWKVGKEMPCKHRFHGDCIEKWLGIHGSCPVCRYTMPVGEEESRKRVRDGDDDGDEQRRVRRVTLVNFSFNAVRRSGDSNQMTTPNANSDSSSSQ